MSASLAAGLASATAAALAYGAGTVLQAQAVAVDGGGAGLLVRLVRQRLYLLGLALDLLGFGMSVLALRSLPLFLVQAALASSVGVTAVLSVLFLGAALRRREIGALAGLGVGLLLLAGSAREGPAGRIGSAAGWGLLLGVGLLAAAAPWARRHSGPALAALAGLAGGAAGICARLLPVPDPLWHVLGQPLLWALLTAGLVCAWAFAEALQATSVTVVTATTFAVSTVLPALVGLALLGDRTRAGGLPVALGGVLVVVAATVALARFADPAPGPAASGPAPLPTSVA